MGVGWHYESHKITPLYWQQIDELRPIQTLSRRSAPKERTPQRGTSINLITH
jgi:hypothetical protein